MSRPLPGPGNLSADFHLIVATLLSCCSFVLQQKKLSSRARNNGVNEMALRAGTTTRFLRTVPLKGRTGRFFLQCLFAGTHFYHAKRGG